MPPRKVAAATTTSETSEPRRSTRISALPQVEPIVKKVKAAVKPKANAAKGVKRGADEELEPEKTGGEDKGKAKPVSKKKAKTDSDSDPDNKMEEEEEEAEASAKAPTKGKKAAASSKKMATEGENSAAAEGTGKSIDIGDTIPSDITLQNEQGEDVNVGELAAEKGLILFLVPKADTPGCTKQACGFRDSYPDFTSLNYNVYCLSADTTTAQKKWQTKMSLPYPLLSDRKRVLIGALGAADGAKTKRSHFIFEKGGKLVEKKLPVKPVDSPTLALEYIKSLS